MTDDEPVRRHPLSPEETANMLRAYMREKKCSVTVAANDLRISRRLIKRILHQHPARAA